MYVIHADLAYLVVVDLLRQTYIIIMHSDIVSEEDTEHNVLHGYQLNS